MLVNTVVALPYDPIEKEDDIIAVMDNGRSRMSYPPLHRYGCQMAIASFLDRMCLALRASGLWLRYATLQNLIPSFPNFAIWQHLTGPPSNPESNPSSKTPKPP